MTSAESGWLVTDLTNSSEWTTSSPLNTTIPYDVTFKVLEVLSKCVTTLCVVAVLLNVLFLVGARAVKDKSTPYFMTMQNLSVADMLASVTFLITHNWPRGPFAQIEPTADLLLVKGLPYVFRAIPWMFMTVYFLSLTLLTSSHYMAVCKPWRYSEMVEKNLVKRLLLVIWCMSTLQIVVPITVLLLLCLQKDRLRAMETLFVVSRIEVQVWMAIFVLSTLTNVLLNLLIYRKIKLLRYKRRQLSYTSQETRNIRRKQKAFVTVTLLILISIFCRLPFPLVGIIGFQVYLSDDAVYLVNALVAVLLCVNFVADPMIYMVRISELVDWYKSVLLACLRALGCHKEHHLTRTSDKQSATHGTEFTAQTALVPKPNDEDARAESRL